MSKNREEIEKATDQEETVADANLAADETMELKPLSSDKRATDLEDAFNVFVNENGWKISNWVRQYFARYHGIDPSLIGDAENEAWLQLQKAFLKYREVEFGRMIKLITNRAVADFLKKTIRQHKFEQSGKSLIVEDTGGKELSVFNIDFDERKERRDKARQFYFECLSQLEYSLTDSRQKTFFSLKFRFQESIENAARLAGYTGLSWPYQMNKKFSGMLVNCVKNSFENETSN